MTERIGIRDLSVAAVERADPAHFLVTQLEVEDVEILGETTRIR
jgi:hypothetical protein